MKSVEAVGRAVLALSMVVMTGAVFLSVIFRYGFNKPLLWSDEVASASLAWMTFIGAAMLYSQRNGHLNLTFLLDRLGPPRRRFATMIADLIELALLAVVCVGGLVFIHFNRDAVTSALELPLYLVYGVVPVTAFVAMAFLIRRMLRGHGDAAEPLDPQSYRGEHG